MYIMSAVAYALSLYTDDPTSVHMLVNVIREYRQLDDGAAKSYHDVLRDFYEQLANRLADVVRKSDRVPRDPTAAWPRSMPR